MNDYFCVMPFYSIEYSKNNTTPCCLILKNSNIDKIKKEMLSGKRPSECQKCWNLENDSKISDRQLKNKAFDFYTNKDIKFIEEDCKNGNYSPQIVKLYTSNHCNSSCVTCSPSASTKWQQTRKLPITKEIISESVLESIDWKNVKMLTFVGGEPLYEKKNLNILENLVEVGNNNCFIGFVTNGSVVLSKNQKEKLSKLKNLNICFSIDGIESKFEYLRFPLKWNTLVDNIKEYKKITNNISVSFTISNLNIMYYKETTKWFLDNNLNYNHNLVTNPKIFNIDVLPVEVKKNLPLVNDKNNFNEQVFLDFVREIKLQDELKNIHIKNYMPEVWDIIKSYY